MKTKITKKVDKQDRVLVQALLEPELKAWVEKMAAARDLPVGGYLRAMLRWAKEANLGGLGYQQILVVPLTKKGKPMRRRRVTVQA